MAGTFHQCSVIVMRRHFEISGQVLVRSWPSVLAVTTMRQSSQVSIPQFESMPINADLPMPWPAATAMRSGWNRFSPFRWSPITFRMSTCQARGPV